MSCLSEESVCDSPLKKSPIWSDLWLNNKKALDNVLFALRLQSLAKPAETPVAPSADKTLVFDRPKDISDRTSLLSDEILLQILSKLPKSQTNSNSLVSKRWLNLQGRLVRSLKLLDWNFLISGRLFIRFPNLIHVDLVDSCLVSPRNSGILSSHKLISFHTDSNIEPENEMFVSSRCILPVDEVDFGLKVLANGYPNLRKLVLLNSSEMGLLCVAEECPTLQELQIHCCNDRVLRGIAAYQNLQILKLIGNVDGFYSSLVSDIGLTILAQGCKRLVKLELIGCEGSYDGIKAIGQCCQMLEELSLCDHRMEDGWLSALSFSENLKKLRFSSCKRIDGAVGLDENLGFCRTLEKLQLEKCQLRDKQSLRALFLVCRAAREIAFQDCWGLDDEMLGMSCICRRVRFLSLERCSLLTTGGLESVVLHLNELESLRVISCNKIKDIEITPLLSTLFSLLKDLIWRPQCTKSLLSSALSGTGIGKRGGKFFKRDIRSFVSV